MLSGIVSTIKRLPEEHTPQAAGSGRLQLSEVVCQQSRVVGCECVFGPVRPLPPGRQPVLPGGSTAARPDGLLLFC